MFDPYEKMVGGFSASDGTIDFYLRVRSILRPENTVLDFGAGRAGWYEDDACNIRRELRTLTGEGRRVIALDVDPAVLANRACDEARLIVDGKTDLPKNCADLIVADYVLEHIEDPTLFAIEVDRLLKKGGWFCARTPHRLSYPALVSAALANKRHATVLARVQPERKECDVFPAVYKMNTLRSVRKLFPGWENMSFLYRADPSYFFGNRYIFFAQSIFHYFLPRIFCGNIFIFLKKK